MCLHCPEELFLDSSIDERKHFHESRTSQHELESEFKGPDCLNERCTAGNSHQTRSNIHHFEGDGNGFTQEGTDGYVHQRRSNTHELDGCGRFLNCSNQDSEKENSDKCNCKYGRQVQNNRLFVNLSTNDLEIGHSHQRSSTTDQVQDKGRSQNCFIEKSQNMHSHQSSSHIHKQYINDQHHQNNDNVDHTSDDDRCSTITNSLPNSHSEDTVKQGVHKQSENIGHVLKIIGDNLDSTATDRLSNDIVLALRHIGDSIDSKIECQSQSFVKIALAASNINISQLLLGALRPQNFVGKVICTSLQFLLRYKHI